MTPRTKAVICQHTFGIPAPVDALRELCDRHHLLLVEDCAHILPDAVGPMDVTGKGDVLLLSFGRDKAVSGLTGGAVVIRTNQRINEVTNRVRLEEQQAAELAWGTVTKLLLYPWLYFFARPLYGIGAGKGLLFLMKKLGLLLPIVTKEEKDGNQGRTLHQLPEACANLVMRQFKRLHQINDHRRSLVRLYLEACAVHGWPVLHAIRDDLPLQKFPMFFPNAASIRRSLKRKNIHLDDGWTGCVVCPASVDQSETGYAKGTDPRAEEACESILSLPTHPGTTSQDASTLIRVLASILKTNKQ